MRKSNPPNPRSALFNRWATIGRRLLSRHAIKREQLTEFGMTLALLGGCALILHWLSSAVATIKYSVVG